VIFLGGLIFLFYGYDCLRNRKYLRHLDSLFPRSPVFRLLVISRVIIIFLIFLVIMLCSALLIMLNGISFPFHQAMLNYLLTVFLCLFFFFALGIAIGKIKSHTAGIPVVIGSWLLLVFILPTAVNLVIAGKANNIPSLYELEMEKLRIIMNFEKRAIEKSITFKYGEKLTKETIDYVSSFIDNEFKAIHEKEAKLRAQMLKSVKLHHFLSSLFPTTLYFSVVDEASSRGLAEIIEFHCYSQDLKKDFFKHFINKLYFSKEGNFSNVENFIKGDENIFHAQSRLPYYYVPGILVTIGFIVLFLFIGYRGFKQVIYGLSRKEIAKVKPQVEKLAKGTYEYYSYFSPHIPVMLYSTFSGHAAPLVKKGFQWQIYLDNIDLVSYPPHPPGKEVRVLYLCMPDEFPAEMVAGDLFKLITTGLNLDNEEIAGIDFDYVSKNTLTCRLNRLEDFQVCEILLTALQYKKYDIYLLDDVVNNMPVEIVIKMKELMEQLASAGALVLCLSTQELPPSLSQHRIENREMLIKSKFWKDTVETLKELLLKERKKYDLDQPQ
jgi:ABC-type transport system involved in multi-copper enzyme maturation permease subunit